MWILAKPATHTNLTSLEPKTPHRKVSLMGKRVLRPVISLAWPAKTLLIVAALHLHDQKPR